MTIAMAPAPPQAGAEIFERILAAPSGLVVLESKDVAALIEQMRALARHSGQAVYLWQSDTGLGSLRDAHAKVPDCERLGNALRYMQQSMHFGVYFLRGLELPLSAVDAATLRQLARAPKGHLRRVVLVDAPPALVSHLGDVVARVSSEDDKPRNLRLRDVRWLTRGPRAHERWNLAGGCPARPAPRPVRCARPGRLLEDPQRAGYFARGDPAGRRRRPGVQRLRAVAAPAWCVRGIADPGAGRGSQLRAGRVAGGNHGLALRRADQYGAGG